MRRPVRTVVGFAAAAVVAIACSFTSSGAGGPGATPDFYEGGLLPDGNIAQPNGSNNGSSNGGNNGNGSSNTGTGGANSGGASNPDT